MAGSFTSVLTAGSFSPTISSPARPAVLTPPHPPPRTAGSGYFDTKFLLQFHALLHKGHFCERPIMHFLRSIFSLVEYATVVGKTFIVDIFKTLWKKTNNYPVISCTEKPAFKNVTEIVFNLNIENKRYSIPIHRWCNIMHFSSHVVEAFGLVCISQLFCSVIEFE